MTCLNWQNYLSSHIMFLHQASVSAFEFVYFHAILDQAASELSAAAAKQAVRSLPMRTFPFQRSTKALTAEGRPGVGFANAYSQLGEKGLIHPLESNRAKICFLPFS